MFLRESRRKINKMTDGEYRCRVISLVYNLSKTAQRHPIISRILLMTGTIQCTSTVAKIDQKHL